MDVVRNCPRCNSENIKGSVSILNGSYIQKFNCQDCGYKNNKDIGSAEKIQWWAWLV